MGKMVDAQSIVVASTATNWYGHEGTDSSICILPQYCSGCIGWFTCLCNTVFGYGCEVGNGE
jgi:L-lactate permease